MFQRRSWHPFSQRLNTGQRADSHPELGLVGSSPPACSHLDEWYLPGRGQRSSRQRPTPFFPEVHNEQTRMWRAPYLAHFHSSTSDTHTSLKRTVYGKLEEMEEVGFVHLCPPSTLGLNAHVVHPSKPCRTTSALVGRAYSMAGSAFHMMVVLCFFRQTYPHNG